jgi:hypothetical protein
MILQLEMPRKQLRNVPSLLPPQRFGLQRAGHVCDTQRRSADEKQRRRAIILWSLS